MFSRKLEIRLFDVVVLLLMVKKWTELRNAYAGCAKVLILPIKYMYVNL